MVLEKVLPLARCPVCQGPLTLTGAQKDPSGHVLSGELECPACPARYAIVDGIPILCPA